MSQGQEHPSPLLLSLFSRFPDIRPPHPPTSSLPFLSPHDKNPDFPKMTLLFYAPPPTESPVPLEFTPFLGILLGVVVTLLAVAVAIVLLIRCRYTSSSRPPAAKKGKRNRAVSTAAAGGEAGGRRVKLEVEDEDDEEEDRCLKAAQPGNNKINRNGICVAT